MASLTYETKTRTGYRLRAYKPGNSARRFSVWLGDVSPREAETAKRHIEAVIESQSLGTPMPGETQRWLSKVPDSLRRKLSPVLGHARNVRDAIDSYLEECERVHKASTVRSTRNSLEAFALHFGRSQMRSLVGEEIDRWIELRNVSGNTAAKIAKHVKTFVTWSRKRGWVDDLRIATSSAVGVGSKDYVEVKEFERLIKHFTGQPQMRCALALARWAGVRVPSEILTLTRSSVDFDSMRLHVIDSKRTMRASRGPPIVRVLPLFPELVEYVEAIWFLSDSPTDSLLPDIVEMGGAVFVERARVARDELGMSWPRLFSSVRATRETELITRFGLKAACEWVGNSPTVAVKHYELITRETWTEATGSSGPSTTQSSTV